MVRNLSFVTLLVILASACAMVEDQAGAPDPNAARQAPAVQTATPASAEKPNQRVTIKSSTDSQSAPTESNQATTSVANESPPKEQIQLIQELLKTSGIYQGPVDGILGPKTKATLRQYQAGCATLTDFLGVSDNKFSSQSAGAPASNVANLANAPQTKSQIEKVQARLKSSGFYSGSVDGIFGPRTKSAIQKYQASQGLPDSGNLDVRTLAALGLG